MRLRVEGGNEDEDSEREHWAEGTGASADVNRRAY